MVRGLKIFTEYFKDFQDAYIMIGGAATDVWMEDAGLPFRATKDLDVILVLEALDERFVKHFWKFIEEGKYRIRQKGEEKPKVYRFTKPDNEQFPFQVEIFSRKPDILGDFDKAHLAPIPFGEELGSLSAILMNDDYYAFACEFSDTVEDLRLASTPAIICLKAKAFLDIKKRLEEKDWKDNNEKSKLEQDYKKHRNDIIRITLILTAEDKIKLNNPMKEDILGYIQSVKANPPDYKQLGKNIGVAIAEEQIIEQIKETFDIK